MVFTGLRAQSGSAPFPRSEVGIQKPRHHSSGATALQTGALAERITEHSSKGSSTRSHRHGAALTLDSTCVLVRVQRKKAADRFSGCCVRGSRRFLVRPTHFFTTLPVWNLLIREV